MELTIPGALRSYDLTGGGKGLPLVGMDKTGRLSLNPPGLFILAGGRRVPIPLTPRTGRLRGAGRLHELLTTRLTPRPDRKSPRLTCFPLPL